MCFSALSFPTCWLRIQRPDRNGGKEPRSLNPHVEETILYARGPQRLSHRPVLGHGLLGPGPHSRRWTTSKQAKRHLHLQALPIARITARALPPVRSAVASDSHTSANPTVNWTCEGGRLCTPCETWIPSDLRWTWGGDASTGDWLQIQIIIRQVDCTETLINQLLADSHQNLSDSGKWQAATGGRL